MTICSKVVAHSPTGMYGLAFYVGGYWIKHNMLTFEGMVSLVSERPASVTCICNDQALVHDHRCKHSWRWR